MRVVLAPDSFKGTLSAQAVVEAVAEGWSDVRPRDELVCVPMADGGEGTLDVVEAATPGSQRVHTRVLGPAGPLVAPWLLLEDGSAVVELARASGLPLLPTPDALGAHTFGFGQQLAAAAVHGSVRRIVATLGGSASTDGGTAALAALGHRFMGPDNLRLPLGGRHLPRLERIDSSRALPPPPEGVEVLVDVDAPLLGPAGAAGAFGAQKGAGPDQVALLEAGLRRLSQVVGDNGTAPGSGAAGGTAFGLVNLWGAHLTAGSDAVARLTRLDEHVETADLVVTGEGRLDAQSFRGKVVGRVAASARRAGKPLWALVGQADPEAVRHVASVTTLRDVAGSAEAAMADPVAWAREAGRVMAAGLDAAGLPSTPSAERAS
ncbi:glycerate kinase [Terrabacter sp. GCM10028922]|uniref:glycerate kinase n=1 Tax=Terrabacter sp. GCM10028922 TaxID=3273428 RepID=UPI003611DA8B